MGLRWMNFRAEAASQDHICLETKPASKEQFAAIKKRIREAEARRERREARQHRESDLAYTLGTILRRIAAASLALTPDNLDMLGGIYDNIAWLEWGHDTLVFGNAEDRAYVLWSFKGYPTIERGQLFDKNFNFPEWLRGSLRWPMDEIQTAEQLIRLETERIKRMTAQGEPSNDIPRNEFEECDIGNETQFPDIVMTGAAGRFADTYSNYIESPKEFMFMSYLTLLGAYGSRLIKMDTVLNTQPRLFTVIVGESADSRKSTAIKKVSELFKIVTEGLFIVNGLGSAEGLQQILKPDDYSGRIPNTLICFDELKSFMDKAGIKNSVLLPAVNELFENNTYHSAVKKRMVEINDAHISLLAASTLATYETIYTSAFINIGFPNRIFLVVGKGKRKYAKPKSMDPADAKRLEDDLNS